MQPQLVFAFDPNEASEVILYQVAQWLEMQTAEIMHVVECLQTSTPPVPSHIKRAVESIGANNPAVGVELNPAIAFGALMNGAAGNQPATVNAQSGAVAEALQTAPTGNAATSQTTPPASSIPVPPIANAALAPAGNVAPSNHAGVVLDKDGIPHDVRIHSKEPTMTDKGYWRKKRGVTDSTIRDVEAQLRQLAALTPPATQHHASSDADALTKKTNALAYADAEARKVCGPTPLDEATLKALNSNIPTTVSEEQAAWFNAYSAKRNAAYKAFMAGEVQLTPPAPLPPAHDTTGLPHDARIHVTPWSVNSEGVFDQRMDVSPETKLAVMAELRGNGAALVATSQVGAASSSPVVLSVPVAPAVTPAAPGLPTVSATDAGTSFPLLMRWIVQNQKAGRITATAPSEVAGSFGFADAAGVGQIALAASRGDFFPHFVETLQAYGAV